VQQSSSDLPAGHAPRPWGVVFALPCLVVTYFGASLAAHGDAARTRACGAAAALIGLAAAVACCAWARRPARCVALAVLCVVAYFALAFGFEHAFRE
jgi:hypothetical protein